MSEVGDRFFDHSKSPEEALEAMEGLQNHLRSLQKLPDPMKRMHENPRSPEKLEEV